MVKNSLNEKIRIIGFWTFGGVFWYLVVAFFLKSDYPIFNYGFNQSAAYDALKDALTLAAAFLAPAAAFILFSNWREQHIEVEIEKNAIELYERLLLIRDELLRIQFDISNEFSVNKKALDDRLNILITDKLFQVNLIKNRLRNRNSATKFYCSMVDQIGMNIDTCIACLLEMYAAQNKITNPNVFNYEFIGESEEDFKQRFQEKFDDIDVQFFTVLDELYSDLKGLDILIDTLRIKI